MDGTLYFDTPMRIIMCIELFFYHLFHPWKIKDLLILITFRNIREGASITDEEDFCSAQYDITALKFSVEPEYVRTIVHKWVHDIPMKWMYLFRDKKLIQSLAQLREDGIKIVVFSDYPVKEKVARFGLEIDGSYSTSDTEINMLKPNRKGLDVISETMSVPCEEILVIGDRYEKDGRLAENFNSDYIILKKTSLPRRIQLTKII
jgi:putative hydrolase of the HAD superfamily